MAVNYLHYDIGQRQRGAVVKVTLQGSAANVLLMDGSNFSAFKAQRSYHYSGGLAQRSPVQLEVPHAGHWYVVVFIPAGYRGSVHAAVRVLPGALPPIRQMSAPSLASIRQAADDYAAEFADLDLLPRECDVFICHAGEDKDGAARPLAQTLRALGLTVWFDEFELHIGDSLRRSIDRGLLGARFGVVVLSPSFFGKGWPNYELDGLVSREVTGGRQMILPVWHQVTRADVLGYSPSLADKLARSTSEASIEQIAAEIAEVVSMKRAA
jgi:hypothetical protein